MMKNFPMKISFTLAILFVALQFSFLFSPALYAESNSKTTIDITLHQAAKSQLLNAVAILPSTGQEDLLQPELLHLFHQQLDQMQKYYLIAPQQVEDLLQQKVETLEENASLTERISWAGKQLHARGVVTATVSESAVPQITTPEQKQVRLNITLWDIASTEPVWEITITLLPGAEQSALSSPAMEQAIQKATDQLRDALVRQGAIYSPRIPQPTLLTTQGNIRSARVVIQPGPHAAKSAFQLLRAPTPETTFTPVGKPQQSDAVPVVLEDTGLLDATTYWYTVVTITDKGMASIPTPPFSITTTGKPQPITHLNATGNGLRQILLSWERATDPNVVGYSIYRRKAEIEVYQKIAEVDSPDQQTYLDRGSAKPYERYGKLEDDTRYWYILRTRNKVGVESIDSAPISARTKGAPAPPDGLRGISNQPRMVSLYWQEATDPHTKGYVLFRATDENGPFEEIDYIEGRSTKEAVDTGSYSAPLEDNTTYFYKIKAVNVVDVLSAPSVITAATTKPVPRAVQTLPTPQSLVKKARLQWEPAAEKDITAYEIYRGESKDEITTKVATISVDQLEYEDTGLTDGGTYWYAVRAIDKDKLKGYFSEPLLKTTKPRPAQPIDVQAELDEEGIMLKWAPNPEQDIAHYTVYSVGFLTNAIMETKTPQHLIKVDLTPGREHRFQVEAVDEDGLISKRSEIISIQIPLNDTNKS